MNRDDLFRGLLAALRLQGIKFIDTRNDLHHDRFRQVVELLGECAAEFPCVPSTFIPSPFTGRYRELDDALLRLQRGLLGAQNPFYPGVNLDISESRAERILATFSPEQRELFVRLANAYLGHGIPALKTAW
ncbi:MAG: hypothetical protein NTY19_04500 [Planctomycetota bacterium]|nr:hypothetical protein [Planctomycetota bacterium]